MASCRLRPANKSACSLWRSSRWKLPFRKTNARGAAEAFLRYPENLLLVQGVGEGRVLIYATGNNLTLEQKEAFIRYLSVEGFISSDPEPPSRFHRLISAQEGLSAQ